MKALRSVAIIALAGVIAVASAACGAGKKEATGPVETVTASVPRATATRPVGTTVATKETVAASPTRAASGVPAGYTGYEDSEGRFSLCYPSGWTKTSVLGTIAAFVGPAERGYSASANVVIEPLPSEMTPEEYFSAAEPTMTIVSGYKKISAGPTSIDGRSCLKHVFEASFPVAGKNVSVRMVQFMFVEGRVAHILTCGSEQSMFDEHASTFEQVARCLASSLPRAQ